MNTLGAVLAGGRSSRMGSDKAEVVIEGLTMLQRVSSTLSEFLPHVVVLGAERAGFECWPDVIPARGPLAGIATALSAMDEDRVLIVAVDQPFVRAQTLERLSQIESSIPVVPVDDEGVRQVTCALYPKAIAEAALEEAGADGSIQSLLDRVSFEAVTPELWAPWGEDGRSWFSVDTPQALEVGIKRFL
ncbi:MAG: molybdenum cofactor guanylyltransferase [Actinomycetota bacterium]|nr:molybdenum cofactor guanylyltransferase [Actinomycetota bacterium]